MFEPMRLVEFVLITKEDKDSPYVGLFDCKDISSITQYDALHCLLLMKNGQQHMICGTLRTLTNRWIYALTKKHAHYEDDIIRPSIMIYHRPQTMGVTSSHLDLYQLKQFVQALKPELFIKYKDIFDAYE